MSLFQFLCINSILNIFSAWPTFPIRQQFGGLIKKTELLGGRAEYLEVRSLNYNGMFGIANLWVAVSSGWDRQKLVLEAYWYCRMFVKYTGWKNKNNYDFTYIWQEFINHDCYMSFISQYIQIIQHYNAINYIMLRSITYTNIQWYQQPIPLINLYIIFSKTKILQPKTELIFHTIYN